MADLFPALRAFCERHLAPRLPARPFRVVGGSLCMALICWSLWYGGALVGPFLSDSWHQAVLVSHLTEATASGIGHSASNWIDQLTAEDPAKIVGVRRSIEADALPFPEKGKVSMADAVRRVDYALVQAVRRMGLNPVRMQLLQVTWNEKATDAGTQAYPFQRLRIRITGTARSCASSVIAALKVRAPGSTARLVSNNGRYVLRIETARTLTHEVYIDPGQKTFVFPPKPDRPRLTVVIDGFGGSLDSLRRLIALRLPFAVAVLPEGEQAREISRMASGAGYEVLLHQPMESAGTDSQADSPYTLRLTMNADEQREQIRKGLARVPEACGISNYRGAAITGDRAACHAIVAEAAAQGLFVLDSVVVPTTELYASAREYGLSSWRRDVVLDHDTSDEDAILENLRRAEKKAKQAGHVVVLGSASESTLSALEKWAGSRSGDVDIVPLRYQPL